MEMVQRKAAEEAGHAGDALRQPAEERVALHRAAAAVGAGPCPAVPGAGSKDVAIH